MPAGPAAHPAADVDVRPLTAADIPALSHAKYFRRRVAAQRAGQGLVLAAFRNDKPVGAVVVLWGGPARERRAPMLYHVRVQESLRRRGIGTQLLAAVHDELRARGHTQVVLGVDSTDMDAIRLYERFGYDRVDQPGWSRGDSRYELMLLDLRRTTLPLAMHPE